MNEKRISPLQPMYLFKIVLGVIVLAGLIVAANILSWLSLSPVTRHLLLGGLIIVSAAIVPFVSYAYGKMDELQKVLHQNACVASLPIVAATLVIVGILQVNDVIPALNQFWTLGMVVGVWAINLMLADRRYK
ncbi:MAG: hypothetical protein WC825_12230 [Gallionellaceae bacterium]|jgi:hypothetical protein